MNRKEEKEFLPLVEEFYSIQGEGFHTGKPAYFIRLGGCDTGCNWCDSPFTWNPEMHPLVHIDHIISGVLKSGAGSVVVTGGEPLMWDLTKLCNDLKRYGIMLFLETSGVYPLTGTWDWICLSPKKIRPPLQASYEAADEIKVIVETPEDFAWAEECRHKSREGCKLYLQPEWSRYKVMIGEIVEYVKNNRHWTISLQVHKFMNIP